MHVIKIIPVFVFLLAVPLTLAQNSPLGDRAAALPPAPQFDVPDTIYSNSGSLKLTWNEFDVTNLENGYKYTLQQSLDRSFMDASIRYTGPDLATFISGLKSGTYHYRVRAEKNGLIGPWSEPVILIVEHHSLKLAFALFGIGAVVFGSTVIVVMRGTRNAENHPDATEKERGA